MTDSRDFGPAEEAGRGGLRASDADRERTAAALRRHHVDGRLDTDELQDRLERCYAARTEGELRVLLADLPGEQRAPGVPPRRARPFRVSAFALVAVAVLLVVATVGAAHHGHPGPMPLLLVVFLALRLARRPHRFGGFRV
jgi:Domain of unknown function (DUF1707)